MTREIIDPTNPELLRNKMPKEIHAFNGGDLVMLSGNSNIPLAESVAAQIGFTIDEPVSYFKNGESHVAIEQNLRAKDVVIIQSGFPNPPLQKTDTEFMVDAARRGSARNITVAYTCFPYQREDQKHTSRSSIEASVTAQMLEFMGANRIMTFDLHAGQTAGSVRIPWDDLPASYTYLKEIENWGLEDMMLASPDMGRAKMNEKIAQKLGVPVATVFKYRDTSQKNVSEAKGVLGKVKGKNVVLVDDMFDTCGSIVNAGNLLMEEGANSVRAVATHGFFSGNAFDNLRKSPFDKILVTNTIGQHIPEDLQDKIQVVDISGQLAEAIWLNQLGLSLSQAFYK